MVLVIFNTPATKKAIRIIVSTQSTILHILHGLFSFFVTYVLTFTKGIVGMRYICLGNGFLFLLLPFWESLFGNPLKKFLLSNWTIGKIGFYAMICFNHYNGVSALYISAKFDIWHFLSILAFSAGFVIIYFKLKNCLELF